MCQERDFLEQQLWEMLHDLLPKEASESLRRRIANEDSVALLFVGVLDKQELVRDAVQSIALNEARLRLSCRNHAGSQAVYCQRQATRATRRLANMYSTRSGWITSWFQRAAAGFALIGAAVTLVWVSSGLLPRDSADNLRAIAVVEHPAMDDSSVADENQGLWSPRPEGAYVRLKTDDELLATIDENVSPKYTLAAIAEPSDEWCFLYRSASLQP
jgi:hypothetical protein